MEPDLEGLLSSLGLGLTMIGPFPTGESRSTHRLCGGKGAEYVLKWSPATPTTEADQARLVGMVDRLRAKGYPAPRYLATGIVDGVAYFIQERLPGRPLEPGPGAGPDDSQHYLIPGLLDLIDLQAGLGDLGDPPWPGWLIDTLEHGGDGYCVHATMARRPDTARMLEQIGEIAARPRGPVRATDIVHFDFTYANVLTDGTRITGVVDWNVPFPGASQGDRAFDVAALLFNAYDRPPLRRLLTAALLARAPAEWAAVYLAHMVLRQVEWALRFYEGTAQERRYVAIGAAVLEDIRGELRSGWAQ